MDTRFVRTWRRADSRRRGGERFDRVLASMPSAHLVEALAGAGKEDPVAANAIATEILNRMRRARLFGAFLGVTLVTLACGLLLVGVDFAMTRTIGLLETSPLGLDVAAVGVASLVLALLSLVAALVAWRRGGPRLRTKRTTHALHRNGSRP